MENTRRICIRSYFSLPTDLAGEMRDWPEFISGEAYTVDLASAASEERVTVRLLEQDGEPPEVVVESAHAGALFDRVLGRVVYALSHHSDDLMIDRHC